ncbi:MAG TPA: disulfide oxidoreductase [Candidatus Saccharimonadales bacterium]|nr:disulfide oxidoreductase [Candidatus Saccharimonadales bacterium]
MSTTTVELFYGILALIAFLAVGLLIVLRLAALASEGAAGAWASVAMMIAPNALTMAWVVALFATAGSLYFSEVAGFEPCTLCWYQRIAMYPLVVILAIAASRRERSGAIYGAALAAVGAVIAAYHVALEWFPALDSGACDPDNPCTLLWFRVFGFISLPTLALAAFLLILALLAIRITHHADQTERRTT